MIKGNESDVGNIDFEIQAYGGDKFLCFTLIWTSIIVQSLQPDVQLRWGLGQNVAFEMDKWFLCWKIKIEYRRHVTHSPWSCHI